MQTSRVFWISVSKYTDERYPIKTAFIIITVDAAYERLALGPAQSESYTNLKGEVGKKNKNFNYLRFLFY